MTYLTLNGLTIPILHGGEISPIEIGSFDTAHSGKQSPGLRKLKRKWSYTTNTLTEAEKAALVGLLYGRGDQWHWDSSTLSVKGLAVNNSPVVGYRDRLAVNGEVVYDFVDVGADYITEALFGSAALAVDPAITNLFPADVRDCENAPTGFTATGSTVSAETTEVFAGTKSLKYVNTAGGQYFDTDTASISASTDYVASFYVRSGEDIDIDVIGDVSGIIDQFTFTPYSGTSWTRCSRNFTTGGSDTTIYLKCTNSSATTSYWDAFQVEAAQVVMSGSIYAPTTWYDGARSTGLGPEYDVSFMSNTGSTLACWIRDYTASNTADQTFIYVKNDDNYVRMHRSVATSNLRLDIKADNVWKSTASVVGYDNDWHHIACTITTTGAATLFFDGASVGTATLTTVHDLSGSTLLIGNITASGQRSRCAIEEAIVLPYAATDAQIAAMAVEADNPFPDFPTLIAEGDFHTRAINVKGRVTGIEYFPIAGDNTTSRVSFEIKSNGAV